MRTRNYNWYDAERRRPMYSFQVFVEGKWANPMEDGKPLIFEAEAERDAKRAEARKHKHTGRQA